MLIMPTKKPIITLAVDEEFLLVIDNYRFEHRITTRSEAIRRLIEAGLKKSETAPRRATRKPPLPQ